MIKETSQLKTVEKERAKTRVAINVKENLQQPLVTKYIYNKVYPLHKSDTKYMLNNIVTRANKGRS